MRDIFKLQDEIVRSLITTVGLELSLLERGIVIPQQTNSLEAYDYLLRGFEGVITPTPEAYARSRKMFERAIALDPRYADAYAWLGLLRLSAYIWQWDGKHALDEAEEFAQKAVSLDNYNSSAYAVLGWVAMFRHRFDESVADGEHAVTLNPNNAFAYLALSEISGGAGKPEAQVAYAKKALRLDPRHPELYFFEIGWACIAMERYRESADAFNAAPPNNPYTHVGLIYAYMELGRDRDARTEAAQVLRLSPKFSLKIVKETFRRTGGSRGDWDDPVRRHLLDDLRKAGLK